MGQATNTTSEKAFGRESKGFKKCATNPADFTVHEHQLDLDINGQQAATASPTARTGKPCANGPWIPDDKPRTKLETMLRLFIVGHDMNRFEAEDHHDHCLHSTVSTLQNDYGIKIDRVSETVPCLRGRSKVRVKRYWLDSAPENIHAAQVLLTMWRRA